MNGVTVVIKAWNEGEHIDRAIASAWAARREVAPAPLEIVVADGLSSDDTVARARRWCDRAPVRVVQLLRTEDRGCGSGVELGWAWARGRWVMLMDGDMELQPGFLGAALAHLQAHPHLAGVGGAVIDTQIRNATDRIRVHNRLGRTPGVRPWLEGGGLYRREAIAAAGGHAADVRLAAFEEADLGLRLQQAGWSLERLALPAVHHHGHAQDTLGVLTQRWRSGRMRSAGRLLRLHLGRKGSIALLKLMAHPLLLGLAWLGVGAAAIAAPPQWRADTAASAMALVVGASMVQVWRKQDIRHVLASWIDWHLMLAGILWGALSGLPPAPRVPASRLIAEGSA